MIVDHGSVQCGYSYCNHEGGCEGVDIGVIFAGPRLKADDVIARDVTLFDRDILVVTADNELMSRCRRAIGDIQKEIMFLQPIAFLADLEQLQKQKKSIDQNKEKNGAKLKNNADNQGKKNLPLEASSSSSTTTTTTFLSDDLADKIEEEIKLRGAVHQTETLMKNKRNVNTPKKRRKLEKRARMLCERLAMKGGQNIDHLTTIHDGISKYDRAFQDEVLHQWEQLRQRSTRREMTGDRMLLAEHFRRKLEKVSSTTSDKSEDKNPLDNNDNQSMIEKQYIYRHHVMHVNSLMSGDNENKNRNLAFTSLSTTPPYQSTPSSGQHSQNALRIVVISDTHGMESSLTSSKPLPDGDILLHLGDFSIDGPFKKKMKAIVSFDDWLSQQPHRTKIILRGNHDPFKVEFPISNAMFYTKPKTLSIDDGKYNLCLIPYVGTRALSTSWRKLPLLLRTDVLATHVPPHGILDACYHGGHVGCKGLRNKVERMIAGPPRLWLCGHIHEGRGVSKEQFGISPRETLVVNAANANSGRAAFIEHGPVVVDVHGLDETVEIVQMEEKLFSSKSLSLELDVEVNAQPEAIV